MDSPAIDAPAWHEAIYKVLKGAGVCQVFIRAAEPPRDGVHLKNRFRARRGLPPFR